MIIQEGDTVVVAVPANLDIKVDNIAGFNGTHARVSRKHAVTRRLSGNMYYYELEGVQSDAGKPYGFLNEWIIKL